MVLGCEADEQPRNGRIKRAEQAEEEDEEEDEEKSRGDT